jgi:hypothetical protein
MLMSSQQKPNIKSTVHKHDLSGSVSSFKITQQIARNLPQQIIASSRLVDLSVLSQPPTFQPPTHLSRLLTNRNSPKTTHTNSTAGNLYALSFLFSSVPRNFFEGGGFTPGIFVVMRKDYSLPAQCTIENSIFQNGFRAGVSKDS